MGKSLRLVVALSLVVPFGCAGVLGIDEPVVRSDGGAGSEAGADATTDAGPAVLRVFVTSGTFTGNLKAAGGGATGVSGAEIVCNGLAKDAGLGGRWVAWLATGEQPAAARLTSGGPWYLVDRTTKVFASTLALASPPLAPLDMDESGRRVPSGEPVWTGDGCANGCSGFTNASADAPGGAGSVGSTTATWTRSAQCRGCLGTAHLYCFEN